MTTHSTKNTSQKSANPPSNSDFSSAINTNFFSLDFFPLKVTSETIQETKLDTVLLPTQVVLTPPEIEPVESTPPPSSLQKLNKEKTETNTKKSKLVSPPTHANVANTKKTVNAQQKLTTRKNVTIIKKSDSTKYKENLEEKERIFKNKSVENNKVSTQVQNFMSAFTKDYIKNHEQKDQSKTLHPAEKPLENPLHMLKKEEELSKILYDSAPIVLNSDIFEKLTNNLQKQKEQSAFEEAVLANALEYSSFTQAFQNEEGIYIPQTLKSTRSKRYKKKACQEDLLGITITSDNFSSTSLRDIDFSDVNELEKKSTQSKTEKFDINVKNLQSLNTIQEGERKNDNFLSDVPLTTEDNSQQKVSVPAFIDPSLDNFFPETFFQDTFSIERMFKVKTVYATSFENSEEEKEKTKHIKTSFFALYDKTEIPLENTLMWDSVHDTFDACYHVFKPTDTKTITENYGTIKQEVQESLNINSSSALKVHTSLTLDDLCLSSPELRDLLNHDIYFNDSISCTQNKAIFEDFNINTDHIDLTGSLGTNYTFEVLYEEQGLLICIRNEKGKFIQCLPVAIKDFAYRNKAQTLQSPDDLYVFLSKMQTEITTFQDSVHSILSSSIKMGKKWFTKEANFDSYNTHD